MNRFFLLLAGLFLALGAAVSARAATLTVLPSNASWGTVSQTNSNGLYAENTNVTITATPGANYVFNGWTGDTVYNASSPTTTILASGIKTVYANFAPKTNTLYVTASPTSAGSVVVNPTGTASGANQYSYAVWPVQTVSLTAVATGTSSSGTPYVFSNWTVVSGSAPTGFAAQATSPTLSFPMDGSFVLAANFVAGSATNYRINIIDDPSPTTTGVQGGTVRIADGSSTGLSTNTYTPGKVIRLVATPAYGYQYAGFSGASITSPVTPDPADPLQNTANARVGEMTVNGDRSIYAHFEPIPRQLSIVASPVAAGTVAFGATPTPLSSTSATTKVYAFGSSIPVTATPNATYRLASWGTSDGTGAPVGASSNTLPSTNATTANVGPLESSAVVTAYFEPIPVYHALTISSNTGGYATTAGTFTDPDSHATVNVALNSAGGTTSMASPGVLDGTTVTLSAVPQANWAFVKWIGGVLNPTTNPATISVTSDMVIQPEFVQTYAALTITYDLSAAQAVGANVTVTGATPNAGGFYPIGSNLILTPVEPAGWRFTGWGGALNGTTTPQQLPFNGDTAVVAKYVRVFPLTATATNGGLVQVGSASPVASYPSTNYDEGTIVNLTAVAPSGTVFAGWTGVDAANGTSATVTMVAAKSVTANFTVVNNVTLSASAGGTATMDGTSGSAALSLSVAASGSATGAYNAGSSVTLSAAPNAGWRFIGWDFNGDGVVTGSEPVTASTSVTVTTPPAAGNTIKAVFTQITHTLTTSIYPAAAQAAGATITGNLGTYNEGDSATLSANAVNGWPFLNWTINGVVQGSNPSTTAIIGMTTDYTAVANFGLQYKVGVALGLSVDATPTATGGTVSITSASSGVSGSSPTLTVTNASGTSTSVNMTVTAAASAGYTFKNWTLVDQAGNASAAGTFANSTSTSTTLTIAGAAGQTYTAKAVFTRTYTLKTAVNGTGTVTPATTATTLVLYGNTFTITSTTGAPSGGWYRSDTGATITNGASSYTFTPSADATVTAVYTSSYALTTSLLSLNSGASSGLNHTPASVSVTPASGNYSFNQSVSLTASQTELWRWASWTNAASASINPTTVTMSTAKAVVANYNEYVPFTMAVSPSTTYGKITAPTATNTVLTSSTTNTNGVGTSYQKVATTASITITAAANSGYAFTGWTVSNGAAPTSTTATSTTIIPDVAKTITANFVVQYTVTPAAEYKPSGSGAAVTVNGTSSASTFKGQQSGIPVVATVPSGYSFTGWRLATTSSGTAISGIGTFADPSAASTTLTITGGAAGGKYYAIAQFSKNYTITVGQDNPALGTVTPSGTISVPYNQTFTVTASSVPGGGWYYRPASTSASTATTPTVTGSATYSKVITEDATILAIFQATQTLTVVFNPANSGVAPNAATVSLSPNTPTAYAYGAKVTITASTSTNTTSAGWTFDTWSSNVSTTSSGTTSVVGYVIMNGNQTVTLNYKPKYVLTMARTPSAVANTTTPATGNVSYQTSGNTVTITATPISGYGFKSWSSSAGAAPANTSYSSTTVYMDADKTVTANFAPTADITVQARTLNGPGGNTISSGTTSTAASDVGGLAGVYNAATLANYAQSTAFYTTTISGTSYMGDSVTVNAIPNAGYDFVGWDADGDGQITGAESTSASYTFTPTGATALTALFKRKTYTLSLLTSPTDAGTAVATTNATLSGTSSYSVLYGDTVTVTATPTSVYNFTSWAGATFANANSATTTLVVTADTTITANFTLIAGKVDIYLFSDPSSAYGTVEATALSGLPLTGDAYVLVNGIQARHYVGTIGQTVQVKATPIATGYGFAIWSGMAPNTGDGALLQDRTNATTSMVATPLTGNTDIRLKATFVPIVAGTYYANLTVRASLDGNLLPTGTRTTMPDNWTVSGSMLDTGVTPNRAWIRLYEVFVTATHRYALTDTETLTVTPPALNPYSFAGWDITYYNGDGSVNSTISTTNLAAVPAFNIPNNVTHNVLAVAKFVTVPVTLTVKKNVTGPDSALLTASADLTSVTPNGTLTSAAGVMPQTSSWLRTSAAPTLNASLGGSTDYVFNGWDITGDGTIDKTTTTVSNAPAAWGPLSGDATVTAYFTRLNRLTVAITPGDTTGNGTINTVGLANGVQAPAGPVSGQYSYGTPVTVQASPVVHNVVKGWKIETDLDDNGTLETVTNVTVADATTPQTYTLAGGLLHATKITAIFSQEKIPTTFVADPAATGTIQVNGATVALPYTQADAHYGDTITLVAVPDSAHLFDRWTVDNTAGASNVAQPLVASTSVFVDVAKTLTAHFVPKATLTMVATPNTPATLNVLSPTAGSHDYPQGTTVTVSVGTPDIHYLFQGWVINGVPTGTATDTSLPITLTGDTTASATFQERNIVTVAVSPAASAGAVVANGSVTTTPGQYLYNKGAAVSVAATPGSGAGVTTAGYIFDHWEVNGVLTPGANPFTIASLTADAAVTAVYVPHPGFDVTLTSNTPAGTQTLTATDGTTLHDYVAAPGAGRYPWHAVVTINAVPAAGYVFANWVDGSNNVVSTSATYVLPQLDAAVSLKAIFLPSYRVDVISRTFPTTAPTGGTVAITTPVSGTSVTLQGSAQVVSVTATPSSGYVFGGWKLETAAGATSAAGAFADAAQASTTLTITGQPGQVYNAVAIFNKILAITAKVSDATQGSVSPNGVSNVPYGTVLSFTATGFDTHIPTGWYYQNAAQLASGAGSIVSTANPYTLTAVEDATITALFQGKYVLTVQYDPVSAATGATPPPVTLSPPSIGNNYDYNTTVGLTTANTQTWEFASWSGPVSSTSGLSTTTTMTQDQTVVAHYKPRYPLTITTNPVSSGTVNPATVSYYTVGTTAAITVTPLPGYQFRYWSNDVGAAVTTASSASTTVVVDMAKTVTANMMKLWAVTVQTPTTGAGSSNPVPGVYYVVPTDPASSPNGLFTVTAVPDAANGWEFDSWESTGNITFVNGTTRETSTATILAAGDATMRPRYKLKRYDLTVLITPTGASSVSTSPLGYLPSVATATARYEYGTLATIKLQTPYAGYAFNSWTGDSVVIPNPSDPLTATILMNGDKTVTAVFDQTRALTILTDPANGSGGTATGAGTYVLNQVVNVAANPAAGWRFRYWAGPVALSSSASTTVAMTSDRTVLAAFELIPPSADLTVMTPVGGTVSIDNNSLGAGGTVHLETGSSHTVTATAAPGYVFDTWTATSSSSVTISSTASPTTSVIFNSAGTLVAYFKPKTVLLTVNYDDTAGSVTVTNGSTPSTPIAGTTNQYLFSPSDTPVITATPKDTTDGSKNTFARWETDGGNTQSANQITIVFDPNDTQRTVSAFFSTTTSSNWTLTVDAQPPSLGSAVKASAGVDKYQLTATPSTYGEFLYWKDTTYTGNLTNTGNAVITVSKPTTGLGSSGEVSQIVTAYFQAKQSVLEVLVSGLGTVVANNVSFPSASGTGVVAAMGSTATLSATATTGWKLSSWTIDGITYPAPKDSTAGSSQVILTKPVHTVLVTFLPQVNYLLSVQLTSSVSGSQSTVILDDASALVNTTGVSKSTDTATYMYVTVQLDPNVSENTVSVPSQFTYMGRTGNVLTYRVLVNDPNGIVANIVLGPTSPSLVLSVNPSDGGYPYIAKDIMTDGTIKTMLVTDPADNGGYPAKVGLFPAKDTIGIKFVPKTADDTFLKWNILKGDATLRRDPAEPDDPTAYLVTFGIDEVTYIEANIRQQRGSFLSRPTVDVKDMTPALQSTQTALETAGSAPILLPDTKIDDREKKLRTHLISGREQDPADPNIKK